MEDAKEILNKYQVDYLDPSNFIYVANKVKFDDYFKNGEYDFVRILELYMKFYDSTIIDCSELGITSFPVYPNMVYFYGDENQLTSFPVQPKMTHFRGDENQLTSFPVQPKMVEFNGDKFLS